MAVSVNNQIFYWTFFHLELHLYHILTINLIKNLLIFYWTNHNFYWTEPIFTGFVWQSYVFHGDCAKELIRKSNIVFTFRNTTTVSCLKRYSSHLELCPTNLWNTSLLASPTSFSTRTKPCASVVENVCFTSTTTRRSHSCLQYLKWQMSLLMALVNIDDYNLPFQYRINAWMLCMCAGNVCESGVYRSVMKWKWCHCHM